MISLARYAELLRQPALRSLITASVIGRLPIGLTGLAVLLLAQGASGSFAQGGTAAACYVAGLAAIAPLLGRKIDRYGPRPILLICALAFPSALVALVAAVHFGVSWLGLACAVIAGTSFPPITVCMRTFFRQQLQAEAQLAAAYSLESVLIETIFIVGPLLVALFVALASPAAAVLFAAVCGLAGTLLFRRSAALRRWRIEEKHSTSLFGPLAEPGFVPLLLVVLGYASAFGLIEIGTAAYAMELGRPALAGVLLGLMSVGSVAGGLVYGSRSWHLPLARQFSLILIVMGLGVAPLALLSAAWAFTLWCVVAGVVMAPALITQSMLVAKIASPGHSTEAFTWSASSLLAGVGLGLAGGGWLLEHGRAANVLAAAAATSVAAGLLALRLVKSRN